MKRKEIILIIISIFIMVAACSCSISKAKLNNDPNANVNPVASSPSQANISTEYNIHTTNPDILITKDQVYYPFKGENGEIIAESYFDKPVLSSHSKSIQLINDYFEEECKGFFDGSAKSKHFQTGFFKRFSESVEDMREAHGDDTLAVDPLKNIINTEVTYMDSKTLSIKESQYWMAGGVASHIYYGATFDLSTGQLLPINHFVKVDIKDFNPQVISLLCENYSKYDIDFDLSAIEEQYNNYKFEDYEFYFDGESIWLIFGEDSFSYDSYIIQYVP